MNKEHLTFNNEKYKTVFFLFQKRTETLVNLQNRIGTKFNILDRKRVLLKEGPLVTLSPHLGSIIRIYIVLVK